MADETGTDQDLTPTAKTSNPPRIEDIPQEQLNAYLAKNRRNMQAELESAKAKAAAFDKLQTQVSDLLQSGIIDGVEDLESFREATSQTISEFKTEREKFESEKIKLSKDLEKATKTAAESKSKYEQAMIQRSISDNAAELVVEGAGREGAIEFFQLKLSSLAEVQEDGSVLVRWDVKDEETGKVSQKMVQVKEALQAMESNPTKYGRYFRSTVNGGAGGETVDGVRRTSDGGIDFGNLSFEKFAELNRKNPAALASAAEKLAF